jgi:UDP-2-acetamido-2,6-beta-L-arabino-hexul-4-ose reductase
MKGVLITGARGFLARNLVAHLQDREDVRLWRFDLKEPEEALREAARDAGVVFHLAGVNRALDLGEFEAGNAGFTGELCNLLREAGRTPRVIYSSSIQAELDNPYGVSKRHGEQVLRRFADDTGAPVSIFRLKNVFGKWCRPNYNSVVATFCHNIARDLPIQVTDPNRGVELVHVDDVVAAMLREMERAADSPGGVTMCDGIPSHRLTLGDLAGRLQMFREMQQSLQTPDFSERFNQQLYATYLSYLPAEHWEYGLDIRSDDRGNLAEFIKSAWFGQVFVSRTRPGVTRGNHYHHAKTEKFLVLSGEGLIRLRQIEGNEILEYRVRGDDYRVVDIPPGYTHSITNVGSEEMITLFWASEIFDPDRPDTYFLPVVGEEEGSEGSDQRSEDRRVGRAA